MSAKGFRRLCVVLPVSVAAFLFWGVSAASASVEFDPVTHEPIQKLDPVAHPSSSSLEIAIVLAVIILGVFVIARARS